MSEWRYIASRLNGDGTETFLDWDLPLSDVQITETLSGPDAITATVTPEVARLKGEDGRPIFEPWSTAIYAEASGVIRAGCIVTPESNMSGPDYSLDCVGFYGYASGMPYTGDRSRVQVDPLGEARHIWSHIQSYDGGNLALVLDDTTSPVRIGTESTDVEFTTGAGEDVAFEAGPYKLGWWQTHNLAAEFEKLAESTPFDFREVHSWSGSVVEHRLRLGYPRLGRRRDDLRFVVGENIRVVPPVSYDDDYASEVLMLGAGEGRKMVRGTAFRSDGRLRRVAVVADKSLRHSKAAARAAEAEVLYRLGAGDISEIVVSDHPNAALGTWSVGDDIFVQTGDTGWGAGLDLWCRITQATTSPGSGDAATLQVVRADRVGA